MSKTSIQTNQLRATAEARLTQPTQAPDLRPPEVLLHELQVHQIELEMQNDELRRAQAALEESRDRYLGLYEFSPVGYFTLTDTGLIEEVNLTGAALLGEERARLLRRRFVRFVSPEQSDQWHQQLVRTLFSGETHSCELAMQRADGTDFQARLDCLCVRSGEKLPMVRIALTDISDHRHAEEELRIAATAFETQQAMLVADTRGVIVRVNQAFVRLTGYSAEEAVGNTLSLLKSERHGEAFYKGLWASLKEKNFWRGEVWNRRKNGKIYADWLSISAVTTHDGHASHYVATFSDITHNEEAAAEIHRLAYYDPLTQLPNRRLLMDRLGQAQASSQRSGSYGALAFLDLDNFKILNDTRGHDIGDRLLVEVSNRLQVALREGDTLSRLGGDEFVLVLEDLSTQADEAALKAKSVGEKVREALMQPYDLTGGEFHCTASLGIALIHGHDESQESLLKQADLALYQAKGAGRNCLRFFDPAMQAALDSHSKLEADLRLALKRQEFQLHYQVQIDDQGRVIGAEALLRWLHPQRGLMLPEEFIPLAEETGLICPIGRWVLETACAQIRVWSTRPLVRDLRLAVNVSPRQFRQMNFVAEVKEILAKTGADASRLKIELTESLVVHDVAECITRMQTLQAMGIRFSMDNFGTGFSSLAYLTRLPLEQLKIDQSFVLNLPNNLNDAVIAQTIINMGKSLGLNVIAEGVETEAQREFLGRHHCQAYQGFLYGRPLPLAAFEASMPEVGKNWRPQSLH